MLIFEENELVPLKGGEVKRCTRCTRKATWTEGDSPMCAWCTMYDPASKWGHKNREEILLIGPQIRQAALVSSNPNVHVPTLDERHRLDAADAEKLMLGVAYTSLHLRSRIAAIGRDR